MVQCQGPSSPMLRLFFLVFTYIWWEDFAKISEVPGAPHNVNPAWSITWLVSVTINCTVPFSTIIHFHLASFYATMYIWKILPRANVHWTNNWIWIDGVWVSWPHILLQATKQKYLRNILVWIILLFTGKILQEAMYLTSPYLGQITYKI